MCAQPGVEIDIARLVELADQRCSIGQDALDRAKEQKFDLVLTDVNMPLMDGISLTRELRALPAYRFVPILMLTTEAGQERKLEGKAAGATGWIVKPFNPDQLIAVVKKVLG